MNTLLGIDLGTTNIKGIIIDDTGNILASASRPCKTYEPGPLMVEQKAEEWWDNCILILRELCGRAGKTAVRSLRAISISSHVISMLPVDAEGKPLRNAIIYQDSRSAAEVEEICSRIGTDRFINIVGGRPSVAFLPGKLLWFKKNEPELFQKTACILQANGWLNYKLTGVFSQDVSPGSSGVLFFPYLVAGERAPLWNSHARGMFIGMNIGTSKNHIIRSVFEGTAFALRHVITTIKESGGQASSLRITGGGSRSRTWNLIKASMLHMELCASMYRYFAAAVIARDDTMVQHDNGSISVVLREPLGVVGLILPWNAPAMLFSWKAAPALAAGNCIVVKPSSTAPLVLLELARLWADILPKGIINIIVGSGREAGEAMLHHPDINKFSFTGSTAAGKHIGAVAGENIIPCTLELGGKSANIIFNDAQLDRALQYAMLAILSTQGEVCVGGSRLLVQDDIYDEFLELLKERFEAVIVGDPADPTSQMGPLINEEQLNKVLGYIRIGTDEGARLVCGGNRITGGRYDKG